MYSRLRVSSSLELSVIRVRVSFWWCDFVVSGAIGNPSLIIQHIAPPQKKTPLAHQVGGTLTVDMLVPYLR